MDDLERLLEFNQKRKNTLRYKQLLDLLDKIQNGNIDSSEIPKDQLFNNLPPRMQYISPLDRNTENYGYMEAKEMQAGNPNIF